MGHCKISNTTSVTLSFTTPRSVAPSECRERQRLQRYGLPGWWTTHFHLQHHCFGRWYCPQAHDADHYSEQLTSHVLKFGTNLDYPNCPSIHCAVDLCTALTTGNVCFFASITKLYPHCVAKASDPQEYAPIILSGIVQSQ
jgi:hypothetical protein